MASEGCEGAPGRGVGKAIRPTSWGSQHPARGVWDFSKRPSQTFPQTHTYTHAHLQAHKLVRSQKHAVVHACSHTRTDERVRARTSPKSRPAPASSACDVRRARRPVNPVTRCEPSRSVRECHTLCSGAATPRTLLGIPVIVREAPARRLPVGGRARGSPCRGAEAGTQAGPVSGRGRAGRRAGAAGRQRTELLATQRFRTFLLTRAGGGAGAAAGAPRGLRPGTAQQRPPVSEHRSDTWRSTRVTEQGPGPEVLGRGARRPGSRSRGPRGAESPSPGITERLCCLPQVISAVSRLSLHNVAQNKGIR